MDFYYSIFIVTHSSTYIGGVFFSQFSAGNRAKDVAVANIDVTAAQ